jgi:hypothetical protein
MALSRKTGYLQVRDRDVPVATREIETNGYVVLPAVFGPDEVSALADDINRVFS